VTNYLLFRFLNNTLKEAYTSAVLKEAKSILENVEYSPTQIPLTNPDQDIYLWYESFAGHQEIFRKSGFPEELSLFARDITWSYDSLGVAKNFSLMYDTLAIGVVQQPLFDQAGGSINIILSKNSLPYQAQIRIVKNSLIWANLVGLLVSFVLAYYVSGFSLKPIQNIIRKASGIKAGTKMERLPVSNSGDEVAQLSTTINEMIDRIESTINTQNTFFASAAHELRTPLANMQSELEYRISTSKNIELSQSWESLRDEVIRLKNVVQDFLLVSQLKNESLELRKTPARLDDVIYDVLEKLKPTLRKSSMEINLQLTNNLELQEIDIDKMESLLVNLIDNARNYGDNSSPLTISLTSSSAELALQIENKISDMPIKNSGNGLGLWICKKIADLHGFAFKTNEKDRLFNATLTIPINTDSHSEHSKESQGT